MEEVIVQKKRDCCYIEYVFIIRHFLNYPHVRAAAGRYNCSGERFIVIRLRQLWLNAK